VVQPAEDLGVGTDAEPGEVEEGEQVVVPDVEEEVGRPGIVAFSISSVRGKPSRSW